MTKARHLQKGDEVRGVIDVEVRDEHGLEVRESGAGRAEAMRDAGSCIDEEARFAFTPDEVA